MSTAKVHFEAALADVDTLLEFHEVLHGGPRPGRRTARLQSLNKSAIVMLCAAWETYIETVIQEAADAQIDAANHPQEMLDSIGKLVATDIKRAKDELSWYDIAGAGWKIEQRRSLATSSAP